MSLLDRSVFLSPGDGVVVRARRAVLWAVPTPRTATVLQQVVEAVESLGDDDEPGRRLLRRLAGLVSAADPDEVPAFAAVAGTAGGLAVMVVGDVDVHVTGADAASTEVLRGRDAATWIDRILDGTVQAVAVVPPDGVPAAPDAWSDLRAGRARAGGLLLAARGSGGAASTPTAAPDQQPIEPEQDEPTAAIAVPTPGQAPPAEPAPTAAVLPQEPAVDFTSISLLDIGPEPTAPLPVAGAAAEPPIQGVQVDGIWCTRAHFNDPRAAYCSVCGISMVQQTHNLRKGPRPSLGVLVLDDGSTFGVDADYVLGREPDGDPAVADGSVLPLVLDDPGRSVSRVHARVSLVGWDVHLSDAGSANGTYVLGPGDTEWQRLSPADPRPLAPGSRIRLGQRELVFDSHHHA